MCGHAYHFSLLVIIEDLHISRARICPTKAHSVLFVNADTELTPATPRKGLQAIPWWNPQMIEDFNRIKLIEFASSDGPQSLRAGASGGLRSKPIEDILGGLIREGSNHESTIARLSCYVKSA